MRPGRVSLLIVVLLVVAASAGCLAPGPLVREVAVSRATLTPGPGDAGRVDFRYALARPATINLILEGPRGERVYLRRDEPRPAGSQYRYQFDGTVSDPNEPEARRVLADGTYRFVLEARDAAGQTDSAAATLEIVGADTEPPRLEHLAASRSVISPNFDAIDDTTEIVYRLTRRATVSYAAIDARGNKVFLAAEEKPLDPGEYRTVWNGLAGDRPVPDGTYQFTVRAADEVGNVTVARVPIEVAASGVPEAKILRAEIAPTRLMRGELLRIEVVVKNTGNTVIRTQGPDPGYVYESFDSFSSIENHRYAEHAGYWRVGVDWAGAPSSAGTKYAYRWGFGHDLQPGEEVTVVGFVRVMHENTKMWFFAGLVQEGIAFHDDGVGGREIQLSF